MVGRYGAPVLNLHSDTLMAFQKGQSGNPGGRPKVVLPDGTSVKELARCYTAKAVNRLAEILEDDAAGAPAHIAAANSLLDRGWGRPTQAIGDSDGNAIDWVDVIRAARERPPLLTSPRSMPQPETRQ